MLHRNKYALTSNFSQAMTSQLSQAFANDLFHVNLLAWMKKSNPKSYMQSIPASLDAIWIPCDTFVKTFGIMKNKRNKLMDIFEALPPSVTGVNLDGVVGDGSRVWPFQMRRVLDALHDVPQVTHLNMSQNYLFTLREWRRKKEHKANDLFNMLMRGISTSVTSLDLSRNDPDPNFTSAREISEKLAAIDKKKISSRRKTASRDEITGAYKEDVIKEYKKKLLQIPDTVKRLDLSYNHLHKFGMEALIAILTVLLENKKLDSINLEGNLIIETLGREFENRLLQLIDRLESEGKVVPIISFADDFSDDEEEAQSLSSSENDDRHSSSDATDEAYYPKDDVVTLFAASRSNPLSPPTMSGSGDKLLTAPKI